MFKLNHMKRIFCFVLACLMMITSSDMSVFAAKSISSNSIAVDKKTSSSKDNSDSESSDDADEEDELSDYEDEIENEYLDEDEESEVDSDDEDSLGNSGKKISGTKDTLPDLMSGADYYDYDADYEHYYSDGITEGKLKAASSVKENIMEYVYSLNGKFESPYVKGGRAVAKQCCAYVNQVWKNVFGVDLYSISDAASGKYSYDGESAYEFFERVGIKTGDVIYTRYQKNKKTSSGKTVLDKNGRPVKTMGQHFVIVLDYDENYVWYTDGYESRTRGFVVNAKNRKVKYSDSKYFRNNGGAYSGIEGAYFARAGKSGCRFRYYRLPESVWRKAGGGSLPRANYGKNNKEDDYSAKYLSFRNKGNLRIEGISENGYEYTSGEICPEITVYDKNIELVKDKDYTAEYVNNTDAGTATVYVTGIGKHKGTVSGNYVINPYDLNEHVVTYRMPVVTETGKERKIMPLISVSISSNSISGNGIHNKERTFDEIRNIEVKEVRLQNDISCEYTYPDECEGAYMKAAEKPYTIIVEGIGNFTGTVVIDERIVKRHVKTKKIVRKRPRERLK